MLHSDQFKAKPYFKLIRKYTFSEGEQFPLTADTFDSSREALVHFMDETVRGRCSNPTPRSGRM